MENSALEGVFVDDLNTLNGNLHILNNNLENLRKEVIVDLNNDIEDLNYELKELQTVVKELSISFKPEMADKQAMLEQSIMSKIDADVVYDSDGNYNLMIGNHRVLDKNSMRELNTDNNQINIGNINITDVISKGSISAKAQIAISDNNEIDKNIYKLDLMASSLIKETNAIYSSKAFETTRSKDFSTPNFDTIPLIDLPELKGLNPGDVTFTLHTDPTKEITININHKTTLEDFKNTLATESNGEILMSYGNNSNVSIYSPNFPTNISNDENTNFKQVMGFNKLLEGYDSKTIEVNREIQKNPDSLFVSNDRLQNNVNYDILDGLADLQFKEVNYDDIVKYNDYYNKEYFNPSNTRITSLDTHTIKDFYANITIDASRVVARSNDKLDLQSKILETTTTKYEENVNVNKDEELMNLMKYQAAYSANAKVISTMNELMDTILRM
jgi:flagellar hook-associated protein 1 FlgK